MSKQKEMQGMQQSIQEFQQSAQQSLQQKQQTLLTPALDTHRIPSDTWGTPNRPR